MMTATAARATALISPFAPRSEKCFFSRMMAFLALLMTAFMFFAQARASTIVNDSIWNDRNGDYIKAGYGGHITLIEGVYYWVENDPDKEANGVDIHIYSSTTLGSGDWTHVVKAVEVAAGTETGGKNCTLLRNPTTGKYVIVSKNGLMFYGG